MVNEAVLHRIRPTGLSRYVLPLPMRSRSKVSGNNFLRCLLKKKKPFELEMHRWSMYLLQQTGWNISLTWEKYGLLQGSWQTLTSLTWLSTVYNSITDNLNHNRIVIKNQEFYYLKLLIGSGLNRYLVFVVVDIWHFRGSPIICPISSNHNRFSAWQKENSVDEK